MATCPFSWDLLVLYSVLLYSWAQFPCLSECRMESRRAFFDNYGRELVQIDLIRNFKIGQGFEVMYGQEFLNQTR